MGRRICAAVVAVVAWVTTGTVAPARADAGPLVITYEVRGRGNVSPLEDLVATATSVYADPRGWSLGGSIRFERVDSGGAFTLWLASDALMSTFGGACGPVWSCRNGRNVVINEERWLASSDSWLAAAAPLESYRQMVINHETGHWLGFGHAQCSAPGAAAPVMQQQSMTLGGCVPNSWPLPSERSVLAARRGVPIMAPGETVDPPSTTTTTTTKSTATTGPAATAATTTGSTPTTGRSTTPTTRPPRTVTPGGEPACLRQVPQAALRLRMTPFWPS
jgi:hypothetical protein